MTLLCVTLAGGCMNWQPQSDPVADNLRQVQSQLQRVQAELSQVRQELDRAQTRNIEQGRDVTSQLTALGGQVQALPEALAEFCPEPPDAATVMPQCESTREIQRVVVSGEKLVVGDVERVWLAPPDALVVARIDAGTETSALGASDVVEFERDGNKWVRFNLVLEGREEPVTLERPLKRHQRVSGSNGPRSPVVALRVQIGDVRENVDIALVESVAGDAAMVLGRNFLTDVALVEVGERFVQQTVPGQGSEGS